MLPCERSQFQRRGGTRAFTGCDDVSAASKRLSEVAKSRLRFAGIRIARFSQHVALGLGKTFESGFPTVRARIACQGAPSSYKFE